MKRKKQGASLIVVIIFFMFVSTVSMAILSMVAANYKSRVVEGKRVENLYASDSGLDVAYNIIGKTFDAATQYANLKVNKMKDLTEDSTDDETSIYNQDYINIQKDIKSLNDYINNTLAHENDNKEDNDPTRRSQSDIEKEKTQKKMLIKEDENMKEILCNEEFKRTFKNFIKKHNYNEGDTVYDFHQDVNQDRLGTKEVAPAPNQLEGLIENNQFISKVNSIDNYTRETIEFGIQNKNHQPPTLEPVVVTEENTPGSSEESKGISISAGHYYDVTFTVYGKKFYDIAVTSTFYTENVNSINTNERRIQANYKMLVPNYTDVYFQNSNGDLHQYLATKDRALTIYGNMNINRANNLEVRGNIFAEGKEPITTSTDRTFEKYHGGITISNSNSVKFYGDVITRNTFNIRNDVVASIGGNLYGRNVYMGGKYYSGDINKGLDEFASGSTLNVKGTIDDQPIDINKGKVVINNDLGLKANNSTINIKDFYGINDRNNDSIDNAITSSSIIVNGNNSTNIDIEESAYIMGTAHIDNNETNDNNKYQTAESGAVKGNYIAYSIPLTEAEKNSVSIPSGRVEKFKYYNPLQLLDPDPEKNTDPAYQDPTEPAYQDPTNLIGSAYENTIQGAKERHFRVYWNADGRNPDAGGITWPAKENIWSSGAIVYKNKTETKPVVISSNYNADLLKEEHPVGIARADFASYVYKFGQYADLVDYTNKAEINFTSLIDTSKIPEEYILTDQQNKGEYAIFNNNSFIENGEKKYKEIQITRSTGTQDIIDNNDSKVIKIQVGNKGDALNPDYTLNAVIATEGNVTILDSDTTIADSNITIKGCIIAKGDLNINAGNVKIKYDSGVVERVQAQNSVTFNTFKAVFGESILGDMESTSTPTTSTTDSLNYDLKNFLANGRWKILK